MPSADRNLLFGILAFQNNFVSRDELMAALQTWLADKSQDLGQLLQERGVLTKSQHGLLSELIDEFIKKLGSAEKCLEKLSSISDVRDELSQLNDPDLQQSLGHVGRGKKPADDPSKTLNPSVGSTSAVGARFRILRPHAEGGLGVVSVAHDEELNREVALKEIKGHCADDPDSRARFTLEAEITGGLEHPGIVPVYGLGTYADGRPFYAMRFIRGDSLSTAIQDYHTAAPKLTETERNLRLRRLLQRFIDVCEAMHYAHSRGVLHRDLKPSNIMLGKYGETLVVDWGLARAGKSDSNEETKSQGDERSLHPKSGSSATMTGQAVGTPAYMSPEQAAGKLELLGPATDIYALGATLYAILTGHPPIEGKTIPELLFNTQRGQIVPVQRHSRHVPKPLEAICLRSLAAEPGQRYATAQHLADEIENWLADESVTAYRESPIERTRRTIRKRPAVAASIIATLLVGVVAFGVGWRAVGEKNRQLSTSNAELVIARNDAIAQRTAADLEANRAKKYAAEAAAERERVSKAMAFLVATFRIPDPAMNGRDVKAADLLTVAVKQVESTLVDEPLLQAELLIAIGRTLNGLGLNTEAVSIAESAAKFRSAVLGPDAPETLDSMEYLATAYLEAERSEEALRLYEETFQKRKAALTEDDPHTLITMANLASAYHSLGKDDKALGIYEQILPKLQASLALNDPNLLSAMGNLGNAYHSAKQFDKSIHLLEVTAAKAKSQLGPDHPSTMMAMSNLATVYWSAGQIDKALALGEQTLAKQEQRIGTDHPHTLATMNQMSDMYVSIGQIDKALSLCERVTSALRSKFGENHPQTLAARNRLADVYETAGQSQYASHLYEEILREQQASLGAEHEKTLVTMVKLAGAYDHAGNAEKALELLKVTFDKQETLIGSEHPETLVTKAILARVCHSAGEVEKALTLYETVLPSMQAILGPNHPNTLSTMANLAQAYNAAGQAEKAMPLYEMALEKLSDSVGTDHPSTLGAMYNLACAYQSMGKRDKAIPLFEEVLAKAKMTLGPSHPNSLKSMLSLVKAYQRSGQVEKEASVSKEFLSTLRSNAKPGSLELASSLSNCGSKLLEAKSWVAAEEALRESLVICEKLHYEETPAYITRSLLGAAMLGRGSESNAIDGLQSQMLFSEAESLITSGFNGLLERKHTRLANSEPWLIFSAQRLVNLYTAWEKPELAAKWQAELEKLQAELAEKKGEEKQPTGAQAGENPREAPRAEGEQLQEKKSEVQKPAERKPAESP